jgi:OTU domain-containing protein 3
LIPWNSALSDQIYGTPVYFSLIRSRVCDYLEAHKCEYGGFLDDDRYKGGWDEYIARMRCNGLLSLFVLQYYSTMILCHIATYAGHLELHCFSRRYRRKLKIIQPHLIFEITYENEFGQPPPRFPRSDTDPIEEDEDAVCYIAYHEWEHYSSIRMLTGPHKGIPKVTEVRPFFERRIN